MELASILIQPVDILNDRFRKHDCRKIFPLSRVWYHTNDKLYLKQIIFIWNVWKIQDKKIFFLIYIAGFWVHAAF